MREIYQTVFRRLFAAQLNNTTRVVFPYSSFLTNLIIKIIIYMLHL